MDEIVFPLLRKTILLMLLAPVVLALMGFSPHRTLLLRIAVALLVGGMMGALAASVLWMLGLGPR